MPVPLAPGAYAGSEMPTLVSAGYDKMIRFWDVAKAQEVHAISHTESQVQLSLGFV